VNPNQVLGYVLDGTYFCDECVASMRGVDELEELKVHDLAPHELAYCDKCGECLYVGEEAKNEKEEQEPIPGGTDR